MKMKKKPLIACTITVSILLQLYTAMAINFNITDDCQQYGCMGGRDATWNITLINEGQTEIEISQIELVDISTKDLIGKYNSTFTLYAEIPEHIGINVTIPEYSRKNFTYNTCFQVPIPLKQRGNEDFYVGETRYYCYNINFTKKLIQCTKNESCDEKSACIEHECQEITCGNCTYLSQRECIRFNCCSNPECGQNQICSNNTCTNLKCGINEVAKEHNCTISETKLENDAETNITPANITPAKQAYNNSNENKIINKCKFYEKMEKEECRFNTNLPYLFAEPFAIIFIGLLIFLTAKKVIRRRE